MAKQTINIGTTANDGTGSTLRDSFDICNDNFTELYAGDLAVQGINEQTGITYTLALTDAGKIVRCANADAITVTIPKNSVVALPIGTVIPAVVQSGAGQVTVAPVDGDVTINKYGGLKTGGQYWALTLVKIDTDTWDLYGGIA